MSMFLLSSKENTMNGYEQHKMPTTNCFHLDTGKTLLMHKADIYKEMKIRQISTFGSRNTYVGKTMLRLKAKDPKTGKFYPDTFYNKKNVMVRDYGGKMETGKTILKHRERPLHQSTVFENPTFIDQKPSKITPTQKMPAHKVLLPLRIPCRPYHVKQPVDADQVQKLSDATLDEEICQWIKKTEENQQDSENALNAMIERSDDGQMEYLYERRGRKMLNLSMLSSTNRGPYGSPRDFSTPYSSVSPTMGFAQSLAMQSHHERMKHLYERRGRKVLNLSMLPSPNPGPYESPRGFSSSRSGVSPTMVLTQSLAEINIAAACANNVDPFIHLPPKGYSA